MAKYWCKTCQIFVSDTKIDRKNHEASSRHRLKTSQFLSSLHSKNRREVAEKEEAAAILQKIENDLKESGSTTVTETKETVKSTDLEYKAVTTKTKTTKQSTEGQTSAPSLLFEKKVKLIQTEASKWQASEKVVATPAEDLQSLLDGVKPKDTKRRTDNANGNNSQEEPTQAPKKSLFKKRKVSKN